MDDERAPWSQPEDSPSQEWRRADAAGLQQREEEWAAMPDHQEDWPYDEPPQQHQGHDQYRQDVYQMPDQRPHYPADPYQLQLPADGVYWQVGTQPDPLCPQHGYKAYPGFTGYPGYEDSQSYHTAPDTPLYDAQQDSDLYFDSQRGFADDDDMNMCSLGSDLCRNMQRGFPTGPPIDDDDDDHPPGSPRSNK